MPRVEACFDKKHPILELNNTKIQNIESVIKYSRMNRHIKNIDLSNSNITIRHIEKLAAAILPKYDLERNILPLRLETLDLSRNGKQINIETG